MVNRRNLRIEGDRRLEGIRSRCKLLKIHQTKAKVVLHRGAVSIECIGSNRMFESLFLSSKFPKCAGQPKLCLAGFRRCFASLYKAHARRVNLTVPVVDRTNFKQLRRRHRGQGVNVSGSWFQRTVLSFTVGVHSGRFGLYEHFTQPSATKASMT